MLSGILLGGLAAVEENKSTWGKLYRISFPADLTITTQSRFEVWLDMLEEKGVMLP